MTQIRLNPSDHAVRGLITATRAGVIVWRGTPQDLAGARGADILHVHSLDAPTIKAVFEKRGIDVRVLK